MKKHKQHYAEEAPKDNRNFILKVLIVIMVFFICHSIFANLNDDEYICPSCQSMEYRPHMIEEVNHRQYPSRYKKRTFDIIQVSAINGYSV